ncbi:M20/M25/M40 family metallo-hydrolase [Kordiimonas laminariae]|uniref:M20/M25/M40 family metallo-hydrolase n=1 Tax=Kordiimonas laminariae TaxID=2917717 RepID=UPI001FF587FA|nr:M20/M25/M40 family metallo-hydrolase [Kordiimonas laminariae]MCK0069817.1 M20/M25/M40 family metallo-hydrolase [Kordiimonas laminariae]
MLLSKSLQAATAAALLFAAPVLAQQPDLSDQTIDTAKMLRDAGLKDDTAYNLLESLTTEIGPRLAGSPKEQEAIDWAIAKFKKLGFDKVYTEPVMVPYWERLSEHAEVLAPFTQPLHITALGKSVGTPEGGVTAEIAHFKTFEDLQKADASDVKGKIVFISNRMERHIDGAGYGPAVRARGAGAVEASKKGALAIVIRSIGTDSHRLPHTGGVNYVEGVKPIAAAALSNPDADLMERILTRGKPITLKLDIQVKHHGDVEMANVIGEITGREQPEDIVLIGGHLDSWDLGTGAVDDGAGVAITMATADLIKRLAPQRPRKTIRVVLFAAEEIGLVGARQYAKVHGDDAGKHHQIGAESDFGAGPIWALASNVNRDSAFVVDKMAQLMRPLGVLRHERKSSGGPDVGQMGRAGMPTLDLMQDGTDYFDLHHTADDTLDKVKPENMRKNVAAWAVFTYIAAEWPGEFK